MSDVALFDVILAAMASVFAYFVATSSRKPSTRIAGAVSVIVSIGLVAADRTVWAKTGAGLLDHLTCAIDPAALPCTALGKSRPIEAPVPSASAPDKPSASSPERAKTTDAHAVPITPTETVIETASRFVTGKWSESQNGQPLIPCEDGGAIISIKNRNMSVLTPRDNRIVNDQILLDLPDLITFEDGFGRIEMKGKNQFKLFYVDIKKSHKMDQVIDFQRCL